MSRYYASIQGSRGPATRQGTTRSGISGHIRGWDIGIIVESKCDPKDDVFYVRASSGSNGGHSIPLATVWREGDDIRIKIDAARVDHEDPTRA